MAREGQGLQILLIVFVFLTMILAFGTWFGISNYVRVGEQLDIRTAELKAAEKVRNDRASETEVIQYMVGFGPLTEAQFKEKIAQLTGGQADPEVAKAIEEIVAEFNTDMDKIAASSDGKKNWRTLSTKLLDVVTKKNNDIATLTKERDHVVDLQKADMIGYDKGLAAAQAAAEKYLADLDAANKAAALKEAELKKSLVVAQENVDKQGQETEKVQTTLTAKIGERDNSITNLESLVQKQARVIRDLQPKEFDTADGKITLSAPSSKSVYINIGSAENLRPQVSFAVYDRGVTKFTPENKKGDIQVERIVKPHLALCRIISTSIDNPMLVDDLVHTPAWKPSRRLQFAIAGFFALDGDQINDQGRFKSILAANNVDVVAELPDEGGKPTGELSPRIRYLVIGDEPRNAKHLTDMGEYVRAAEKAGLEVRYYRDVLEQMGVRGEAEAVRPGREDGASGFQKRRPNGGKKSAYAN